MPPNNLEAMTHHQDTIPRKVPFERIAPHVSCNADPGEVGRREPSHRDA